MLKDVLLSFCNAWVERHDRNRTQDTKGELRNTYQIIFLTFLILGLNNTCVYTKHITHLSIDKLALNTLRIKPIYHLNDRFFFIGYCEIQAYLFGIKSLKHTKKSII